METRAGRRPLRIGVLVDLYRDSDAGGHVKCWERFAEAATSVGERLDLTVHFLGRSDEVLQLAPNVRYVTHPPVWSTERLRFLRHIGTSTDLAPHNRALVPHLGRYDVVHTTHPPFTLSRTASRYCERSGVPLTSSVHTDTPSYTRAYVAQLIPRLVGDGRVGRLLLDRGHVDARLAASMARKVARHWARCRRIIVSRAADFERVADVLPRSRISYLRRGIDLSFFQPERRDRQRLHLVFDVPIDRPLLLWVGRLDPCKSVMTFARAVRTLIDRRIRVHAMVIGKGNEAEEVRALLGPHVTMPGVLPHSDLAWIYPSADLFVFPSRTEIFPNVVLEAKASGLPVLVSDRGGAGQLVTRPGWDGDIVKTDDSREWAERIAGFLQSADRLTAMGVAARRQIESEWPTWESVLENDLMPVWELAARTPAPATSSEAAHPPTARGSTR